MTGHEPASYPVHVDARGALVAVEFDDVDHPVRRVFVVTDCPPGVERGHHRVPCGETVVLLAGGATFWIDGARHRLGRLGDRLDLTVGAEVRYCLDDRSSAVLVLAEDPFTDHPETS